MIQRLGRLTQNAHLWLPGYLKAKARRRHAQRPKRVWLAFADHFEPYWKGADETTARDRVARWVQGWPEVATRHRDSAGRLPRYTFFYPEEEYRPAVLDQLASLVEKGIADVEVHLHHDGEGERNFIDRISAFTGTLFHQHGLLRKTKSGVAFGFIHGNWALDNSRPDGRWCGLNNEILLLKNLGCYGDFTLPSVPEPTQTRMVNTIYWATDDPERPKSHNTGVAVTPGGRVAGDLMMIPGPLALNWRAGRLLPRTDTGELAYYYPVSPDRIRLWLDAAPQIGQDLFIKLFTHGAQEANASALIERDLDCTLREFQAECGGRGMEVYYVSAFEMWLAIDALRREQDPRQVCFGNPLEKALP